MAKQKFYTVWRGHQPGVYQSWAECEAQVKNFANAQYKSFPTYDQAQKAFQTSAHHYIDYGRKSNASSVQPLLETSSSTDIAQILKAQAHAEAIAVDAACSKNPGPMEYRGVHLPSGKLLFHFGPLWGTNNIGEFLAIVHAQAYLQQLGKSMTIYSDSHNAINWVRAKRCKTSLVRNGNTEAVHQLIARAETWLKTHQSDCPVLKWETELWGEIPADFGRKK